MKRRLSSLAFIISVSLCCGCAARVKTVTNLPPGVTQAEVQQWDAEVANLHKVATVVSTLRQTIITAEKAGAWPDTVTYVKALQTVAKIDQLELAAADFLKQQPQHFGVPVKQKVADYVNEIGSLMDGLSINQVFQIKNADTQNQLKAVISELEAILALTLKLTQ